MLGQIAFYSIMGKPVMFYMGIIALILFIITGMIPLLRQRAILNIPMEWHFRLAKIAIVIALLHGIFALSAYF